MDEYEKKFQLLYNTNAPNGYNLIIGGMKNKQNKTFVKKYSNRVPIGRMAKVNEYNGPILFLSSDLSSYMPGSSLIVDGGWTAI